MMSRLCERGTISVEFALCMPLLLMVLLGGVHFGRVIMTRHKLTEATNYATRAAAIAGTRDNGDITGLIVGRMGATGGCSSVVVNTSASIDGLGLTQLLVTASCAVNVGFGSSVLGAIGPDTLTVTAAMPL